MKVFASNRILESWNVVLWEGCKADFPYSRGPPCACGWMYILSNGQSRQWIFVPRKTVMAASLELPWFERKKKRFVIEIDQNI